MQAVLFGISGLLFAQILTETGSFNQGHSWKCIIFLKILEKFSSTLKMKRSSGILFSHNSGDK